MPNYYQHNGTSYVHVSDYATLEARVEFLLGMLDAREARLAGAELVITNYRLASSPEYARAEERLAEATELLARAEDDLSEWERIHGDDPQTTRLRLEIMGFRAADSANERRCECGERLSGHEDESSTKCRWCVTGWKPSKDDQADSATHRETTHDE